jgi:CheY-like chemotaxis protein
MKTKPLRDRVVLVVEDEIDFREAHRALLLSLGARVVVGASGREGLEQLARWHPDLVLCDLT